MGQLDFFKPIQEPNIYTVIEVTRLVRELLEEDHTLQDLWVQGEVSTVSQPKSGHLYFTLKDSDAVIKCVMWRNQVSRQSYMPEEGASLEVHGSIGVYEAGGSYQLYADKLRSVGEGELYRQYLELKNKLETEGLFELSRKRPIPAYPRKIGIVTSSTGAALGDILSTLDRRYPLVKAVLVPTSVQGARAPTEIVDGIMRINQIIKPDVILLVRGGGSIEDLSAFNDERVARAIAASEAPIISGVGHDTDYTIADFTADLRAPTPTAAAELATPDIIDLRSVLVDNIIQLGQYVGNFLMDCRWQFERIQYQLERQSPLSRTRSDRQRVDELVQRVEIVLHHKIQLLRTQLIGIGRQLDNLDPKSVLGRGYALVTHEDGRVVSSVSKLEMGNPLNVQVSDGVFGVEVSELEN
jgi:exodeoxyribonuclease VII large subunit